MDYVNKIRSSTNECERKRKMCLFVEENVNECLDFNDYVCAAFILWRKFYVECSYTRIALSVMKFSR